MRSTSIYHRLNRLIIGFWTQPPLLLHAHIAHAHAHARPFFISINRIRYTFLYRCLNLLSAEMHGIRWLRAHLQPCNLKFFSAKQKICVSYSSNRLFTSSCLVDFWISVDSVVFSFSLYVSWFWYLLLFKNTNKTKKLKSRDEKKRQTRTANREPMISFIVPHICLSHLLCWFLMQPFLIDYKVW